MENIKALKISEKIGYGLGDTASNLVFQTLMIFSTYFYTEVFGLSVYLVGFLLIIVHSIDGLSTFFIGFLVDRTNTRWGKFRPYILWFCFPLAFFSCLAFTTPDFTELGKFSYALVTLVLLTITYSLLNIPYCALAGYLTQSPQQRISLQSYRFSLAMLGGLMISAFMIPMVEWLGAGDEQQGFQLAMIVLSSLGLVFFLICFYTTRERVANEHMSHGSLKQNLSWILSNPECRFIAFICFLILLAIVIRNSVTLFYVGYYLDMSAQSSLFLSVGMIGSIIGSFSTQHFSKYIGQLGLYRTALMVCALISCANYWVLQDQFYLALVFNFGLSFFLQMGSPILWSMLADVADYAEEQSKIHLTGAVYSVSQVSMKLGIALGGGLSAWSLGMFGYQADSVQTETSLHGILIVYTIFPAVLLAFIAYLLKFYKLSIK
ncbi:glycoside-pentoside-hexuronide (GPH):cation symporter [Catenovulum maritimum]|uniref:glycoside-pentoside-hexuronide (GPH):cation symporter n=1 Tax=Catenovulum maritimum TaxID=1513271 RepID=UPI00155A1935|nr:glycoside-pentoside-hexuronide (GPH):cation symporter [Catenovulum maritimum]